MPTGQPTLDQPPLKEDPSGPDGRTRAPWAKWFTDLWNNLFGGLGQLYAGTLTLGTVAPGTPDAYAQYRNSVCRAWGWFTVAGGAITLAAGFNMDVPVYNAAGDYSLKFKTPLADALYSAAFGVRPAAGTQVTEKAGGTRSAAQLDVSTGGANDVAGFSVQVFGN